MKRSGPFSFVVLLTLLTAVGCSVGGGLPGGSSSSSPSGGGGAAPNILLSFGGQGTGPGLFTDPRGLAVNPSTGAMAVADYQDGRIQAFDPTGKQVAQWSEPKAANGTIVTNMAGDAQGNVFVANGLSILKFDSSGQLKATWSPDKNGVSALALEANGDIIAAGNDETIYQLSPAGKVLMSIKQAFSGNGGNPELNMYVATDAAGDIFALGTFNNAVFQFTPKGKFTNRFGSEGSNPGQLDAPGSIAIDSKGNVYVGDFNGIQVFSGDGTFQRTVTLHGVGAVRFIAFDAQDNLYVTTGQNKVLKLKLQ